VVKTFRNFLLPLLRFPRPLSIAGTPHPCSTSPPPEGGGRPPCPPLEKSFLSSPMFLFTTDREGHVSGPSLTSDNRFRRDPDRFLFLSLEFADAADVSPSSTFFVSTFKPAVWTGFFIRRKTNLGISDKVSVASSFWLFHDHFPASFFFFYAFRTAAGGYIFFPPPLEDPAACPLSVLPFFDSVRANTGNRPFASLTMPPLCRGKHRLCQAFLTTTSGRSPLPRLPSNLGRPLPPLPLLFLK